MSRTALYIVVAAAGVVAIILLVRRETKVGGLLGLTVEQRAKMLEPIAEYLLRRSIDDDVMGHVLPGSSVTVRARALSAWSQWKHAGDAGELKAWSMAIVAAREKINAEQDDFGARILEGLGAMLGAVLATLGGGPLAGAAAWGAYVGQATLNEIETQGLLEEANAYFRSQVKNIDRDENDFYRFLWCAPDAGGGPRARGRLPKPEWWDDRQPSPENVKTCARFAFADRPTGR